MNNEVKNTKEEVQETPKEKKELFGFFKKKKAPTASGTTQIDQQDNVDEGLNLIPTPTKEEVAKEGKKAALNIGSAFSLLTLVLVSVFVISFNIMSKMELNKNRESLYAYETEIKRSSQEIIDNNEVVDRIFLYKSIQEKTFSPKAVIEYVEDIAEKSGGINIKTYDIQEDLTFEIAGESQDLEKVSKFWYLLCNDDAILDVNLNSVSKGGEGATFSFEGQFVYEYFVNVEGNESN